MPAPKDPIKREEWKRKIRALHQTEEWRQKQSKSHCGKKLPQFSEEHRRKLSISNLGKIRSEETRKNISKSKLGITLSDERKKQMSDEVKSRGDLWHKRMSDVTRGERNPFYKKRHSEKSRDQMSSKHAGVARSIESRLKQSQSITGEKNHKYGTRLPIATRKKISDTVSNLWENDGNRIKFIESKLGGMWYGSVKYPDPPKYCELWCPDLWHRIDEAQNYQSILSGKTKENNGGRALSRHHVYWQPKACCGWDEDAQGYYAMINIGTANKPNWHKYYIQGDPNKFVLLTMSEHKMISKDKLKWIKIFEDLIKTKLNGVCYLPKVES